MRARFGKGKLMTEEMHFQAEESSALQLGSQRQTRTGRRDRGAIWLTERDEMTLRWIGEQYAVRLDQLQVLLGRAPGRGAHHADWVSEGAARDVVTRWKKAGWVSVEKIRAKQPFWVWLTAKGLRKVGLPYKYADLAETGLDRLDHLYAINVVRLELEEREGNPRWVSDRHLAMGVQRTKGRFVLHRPDGEIVQDGGLVAIEVELSPKGLYEQEEVLLELLWGQEYLRLKEEVGKAARTQGTQYQGRYEAVWYFAAPEATKRVVRAREALVKQGVLSLEDAELIHLYGYPLARDEEEEDREEQRNEQWIEELST
jgi:hypothetical protein